MRVNNCFAGLFCIILAIDASPILRDAEARRYSLIRRLATEPSYPDGAASLEQLSPTAGPEPEAATEPESDVVVCMENQADGESEECITVPIPLPTTTPPPCESVNPTSSPGPVRSPEVTDSGSATPTSTIQTGIPLNTPGGAAGGDSTWSGPTSTPVGGIAETITVSSQTRTIPDASPFVGSIRSSTVSSAPPECSDDPMSTPSGTSPSSPPATYTSYTTVYVTVDPTQGSVVAESTRITVYVTVTSSASSVADGKASTPSPFASQTQSPAIIPLPISSSTPTTPKTSPTPTPERTPPTNMTPSPSWSSSLTTQDSESPSVTPPASSTTDDLAPISFVPVTEVTINGKPTLVPLG